MNNGNHIIQKVFLDVNTSSIEKAYSIKNNISIFLKNELFPKLELLFKKYSFNNKIIRFDKLNVDFSIEKWYNFEGIKFEICNQLEEEIKKQGQQISKNEIEQIDVLKPENQVLHFSEIENLKEIFLFFLENAYLPWYGKEEHILELCKLELWHQCIKETRFIQKLKRLLTKSDPAIERFIYQFADDIIITFLIEVNPKFKTYEKSLFKFLPKVNTRIRYSILYLLFQISISAKRKKILDSLDSFIIQIKENKISITEDFGFANLSEIIKFIQRTSANLILTDSSYLNRIISEIELIDIQQERSIIADKKTSVDDKEYAQEEKELTSLEKETFDDTKYAQKEDQFTFVKKEKAKNAVKDKKHVQVENELTSLEHEIVKNSVEDNENEQKETGLTFFDKETSIEDPQYVQKEDQFTFLEKELGVISVNDNVYAQKEEESRFFEKETNEIAVSNAGLVLVHPFLKQFFIENKIADEFGNMLKDKLGLAVQSLHFLATGNENVFEGKLVFEKFLCGVPLNLPIQKKSLINAKIKEEALTLLNELIKNWPALKKTSPEGLQQMFLQRDGKLIQKNQKYKLIVERKAQDLLLAKLNWNISVLKLPWRKTFLFVEW